MKLIIFIKKYAMAIVACMVILCFSVLKVNGGAKQKRMTVAVYFHGNPNDPAQIANHTLWNTNPNGQTCSGINHRACMLLVDHTDLTPTATLNPVKIKLGSVFTGVGYVPTQIGGSTSTIFTPINRN